MYDCTLRAMKKLLQVAATTALWMATSASAAMPDWEVQLAALAVAADQGDAKAQTELAV